MAFNNDEIPTKTIDIKNDVKLFKISIKTPFEFIKSNKVSKIDSGDKYYVCGYTLKQHLDNVNLYNKIILYDCNEGRLASP